ncbi:binding--dependent transport system inner membrane component family protein, partial [Chlamydia psittaci 08DC60]
CDCPYHFPSAIFYDGGD